MCGGQKEQLNHIIREEIHVNVVEEHEENQLIAPLEDNLVQNLNQTKNRSGRIYDVEKNKAFLKNVSDRVSLAAAEERANGQPVGQFKMKSKYLKGVKQRKRDTAVASNLIAEHGNNIDINYRSYRIFSGWSTKDDTPPNTSIGKRIETAISEAQNWKLSWNMLKPNVLADCVLQVRRFYQQYKFLSSTMNDPEYAQYYSSVPEDRFDLLSQIIRTSEPLARGVELTFSGMGLSLDENGAISYKDQALTDEQRINEQQQLHELKATFTERRTALKKMDEGLIKHYKAMTKPSDTSLLPLKYQSTKNASTEMFDNLEKKGTLKTLDDLYSMKGSLKADFCKEYGDLMFKIIEKNDFTFDDQGIDMLLQQIADRVKWECENNANSNYIYKKPELIPQVTEERQNAFKTFVMPQFKKVFKLVNDGVVGKDTAKLFMSTTAMHYQIKQFERKVYESLAKRNATVDASAEYESEYKEELLGLAQDLRYDVDGVDIQNTGKMVFSGKYEFQPLENIAKSKSFIRFYALQKEEVNVDENDQDVDMDTQNDVRCYVTVKEDKQKEMVVRLRQFLKDNPKFKGAFNFKLMSTANEHKLDNIVIYLNSKKTDPKLFKEFLDGFHNKIKDLTSKDDSIPTTNIVKQGFGLSAEPKGAFKHIFKLVFGSNPLGVGEFDPDEKIIYGKATGKTKKANSPDYYLDNTHKNIEKFKTNPKDVLGVDRQILLEKGSIQISWNQYCSRLLILSSYVARHRLNRTANDTSVSEDEQVKKEMRQVFQEFMILSDINPDNLMLNETADFMNKIKS